LPAQFAMVIMPPSIQPAPAEEDDGGPGGGLAARVASGPGFWTDWLAELDRQGLLEELLAEDVIARALREAPSGHRYDRVLTEEVTYTIDITKSNLPKWHNSGNLRAVPRIPTTPARWTADPNNAHKLPVNFLPASCSIVPRAA
jgi:hypothetical protein